MWPVIVTPYNLPQEMCMNESYMFLTVIFPGTNNPKRKIDVNLKPLINKLALLWDTSIEVFKISKKKNLHYGRV